MKLNIPIRSKTFLSYLASFLSVVLLPLLALWVMLSSTLNHSVQEQFLSYESQILRSVSEQIDVNISYSIYVSYYLADNRSFKRLMMATELPRDDRENCIREASGYLRDVIGSSSIHALSCAYLVHKDLVIDSTGSSHTLTDFFRTSLKFEGVSDETFAELVAGVDGMAFLPVFTRSDTGLRWLCLVKNIPTNYLNRPSYVLSFYQVEKLYGVIAQRLQADSLFSVYAPDGAYLAGTAPVSELCAEQKDGVLSHAIEGVAYLSFYESSLSSGLQFVYYLPQAHVLRQLTSYQRGFLTLLGALLALCAALALFLACRHYAPIKRIFQHAFPDEVPSGCELQRVSEQLTHTRELSEGYMREIQRQYQQLRNQLLVQLLTVESSEPEALPPLLAQYNFELGKGPYIVAVVRGCPVERLNIDGALPCRFPTTDYCALIVPAGALNELTARMNALDPGCRWRAGAPCEDAGGLVRSFQDALAQLEPHGAGQGDDIMYYPVGHQMRLINALGSGDSRECEQIISELWTANMVDRRLSDTAKMHLLYRMATAACHVCAGGDSLSDRRSMELMDRIMSATVPDSACFDDVVALCRHVTRLCGVSQQEKSRSLTDAVLEYIEQHYAEADLSLQSVADACHVSYYYLSRMFKSKTQQSFSDLLNTCRVRKACEQLLNTDLQAQEIAAFVGYTNANTFYRAFRKLVGLTPQQYRANRKGAPESTVL